MNHNNLNPEVWGPHYWFMLHTIAINYPLNPTKEIKKKYYDFINNLSIFIPNESISNRFKKILDKYPVSPYLDSKESIMKWMHFIHNKINRILNKDELTYQESLERYYKNYIPKELIVEERNNNKKNLLYSLIFIILIGGGYILYNK
jgi:hypothetical protein